MLYINCVCVLKASFKRIDENVAHLQKIVVKPRVPTLICQTQRNQFLLIELKILKKQHLMISDAVQMLNVIFSLQLLATILLTFCVITFEIYSYAVRWQNGILINIDIQFIFTLFTSIGHYIIKMTLLVWACETSKNQAQEIITTVHDLLNSTNDEQIKNELQLFSLQILHRKNTFSLKGLTIDATLLAAVTCFKNINDNLVHIQKIVINDMKSRVSNVICHTQRNNFLLIELRILKKKHLMTSNAVQMLNIIFNLQLLAAIVMSFLIVTFELYFYAVRWQNGVLIGLDWHFLDVLVTSVTYNIFQIILIVWACETGKNQARNIGTTVHDLLNSTNNEKIKYELQLFSLQVLHRKNTFSVKGLTIDATLLTAVTCFKRLNENMAHLQKLVVKPCIPRLICHIQRNQLFLIQLKILQKQHLMISNTVQKLNLIFSLQLYATIIMTFSDIIFEVYYYVVRWQDGIHITFDLHFLDVFSISVTFYILKIMLITWACETGKNQAQEIGTIIHDVLNSTSNEQIKNEVIRSYI
ncbi:Putative gustatory receptor 28b [Trachymyrmex cornetzi]|uniref:Gustatory receptor n=1 Tax=Trachymyrmex cornetzi TaxID=471704 RepID=A0A195DPT8_9HYME|nr:Putative gustatory receptor 28b [Trachymyrmex cornetzi]